MTHPTANGWYWIRHRRPGTKSGIAYLYFCPNTNVWLVASAVTNGHYVEVTDVDYVWGPQIVEPTWGEIP